VINEATAANLRRKSAFVDKVQMRDGVPLPSWIDLNLTELCNRKCVFCPRVDPDAYPNQPLHMNLDFVRKLAGELRALDYRGAVVLCGFGEPMLHPDFIDVVRLLSYPAGWRLEVVTNGDKLDKRTLLMCPKVSQWVVSMYDGPHQVEVFTEFFRHNGIDPERYTLRDRWHTGADQFGLKLTNRAGTVSVGDQPPAIEGRPCHYLTYQLTVDWNGDVLLCPQEWHKRVKFGNLAHQPLMEVWAGRQMSARRARLIAGNRSASPCAGCNTDGCLHGFNHVPAWNPA
jgi:radical SAM protein with 4Fe4S-binding SPASM domain